jgi:hypothetical protein
VGGLPADKEDDKMEAVVGLFMIVILVALLSGAGRSGSNEGEQRPVRYIEVAPNAGARSTTATRESSSSSLVPALVLLLTILALFVGAR